MENEIVYIAGFFGGEGSIFISKSKKAYFLTVSISNINLPVSENIQKLVGGGVSKSPDDRQNHSPLFRLRLYCNEAKAFLEKILPHLKIKKEQAKLAIEFQSKMGYGGKLSKQEKERYRILVSSFNKKRKCWCSSGESESERHI